MSYLPIEDYGIIGDMNTAALIGKNGSIDFLCFPEFDSPSIFASILDKKNGGFFQISPIDKKVSQKQIYLPDTNILITQFISEGGISELSDFMPVEEVSPQINIVRRVKVLRGNVKFKMICNPCFNYGLSSHHIKKIKDGYCFTSNGNDNTSFNLRSNVILKKKKNFIEAVFTVKAGESATFLLEEPNDEIVPLDDLTDYFDNTVRFWRKWTSKSKYKGRWQSMVNRSALTLKLMISQKYGSIVAAPTFGLPELIGGERNWDYRYCWIRDSAFAIHALIRLGYTNEAGAYINWITRCCLSVDNDKETPLQLMYKINGKKIPDEKELNHFEGYRKSNPVRVGNGAANQLQLDIYGMLLDSIYHYNKFGELIGYDVWKNLYLIIEWVCKNWYKPDEGIWEVRGGKQEFLYSRLMCWVALDRGIKISLERSFPAPIEKWNEEKNKIYNDIFENFWDEKEKTFVQYKGSDAVDASSLLMPIVGFISPIDPYWLSTLNKIEERLADDFFIHRYNTERAAPDGLKGTEGTFGACSFWYIECLARAGYLEKARLYLEKMFGYANHLGLYAEEFGHYGEHLGNFPQAFTHLGLISATYYIETKLSELGIDS